MFSAAPSRVERRVRLFRLSQMCPRLVRAGFGRESRSVARVEGVLHQLVQAPQPDQERRARAQDVGAVHLVDAAAPHRADPLPARARRS